LKLIQDKYLQISEYSSSERDKIIKAYQIQLQNYHFSTEKHTKENLILNSTYFCYIYIGDNN